MAQFAYPDSTVTQGTWTAEPVINALWQSIDEETPNDADYIEKIGEGSCEVGLSNLTDPFTGIQHHVRFRAMSLGSTQTEQITVTLVQGTTSIASATFTLQRNTFALHAFTLSEAQANAITDYTDLRLRFNFSRGEVPETCRAAWAEFEVPDNAQISGSGALTAPAGAISGAGDVLIAAAGSMAGADATLDADATLVIQADGGFGAPAGVLAGEGTVGGASEINGDGALVPPAAVLNGSAGVVIAGAGGAASALSILQAIGSVEIAATGDTQAPAGALSGAGTTEIVGGGALASAGGVLGGDGTALINGSGALAAAAGVLVVGVFAGDGAAGTGSPNLGETQARIQGPGTSTRVRSLESVTTETMIGSTDHVKT